MYRRLIPSLVVGAVALGLAGCNPFTKSEGRCIYTTAWGGVWQNAGVLTETRVKSLFNEEGCVDGGPYRGGTAMWLTLDTCEDWYERWSENFERAGYRDLDGTPSTVEGHTTFGSAGLCGRDAEDRDFE